MDIPADKIASSGAGKSFTVDSPDVTATKALEQELETHRLHLEQLVRERPLQLEEARNAAEARFRWYGIIAIAISMLALMASEVIAHAIGRRVDIE